LIEPGIAKVRIAGLSYSRRRRVTSRGRDGKVEEMASNEESQASVTRREDQEEAGSGSCCALYRRKKQKHTRDGKDEMTYRKCQQRMNAGKQ